MSVGSIWVSVSSIKDGGVSLSISRPLGHKSPGHGVDSLGDGVQTSAGSKGDTIDIGVGSISIGVSSIEDSGISFGLSISRPLAVVPVYPVVSISVVGAISLGGGVKALGDWVKSGAGAEGNISIGVGISKATIVSIGISLSGSKSGNTSQNN